MTVVHNLPAGFQQILLTPSQKATRIAPLCSKPPCTLTAPATSSEAHTHTPRNTCLAGPVTYTAAHLLLPSIGHARTVWAKLCAGASTGARASTIHAAPDVRELPARSHGWFQAPDIPRLTWLRKYSTVLLRLSLACLLLRHLFLSSISTLPYHLPPAPPHRTRCYPHAGGECAL